MEGGAPWVPFQSAVSAVVSRLKSSSSSILSQEQISSFSKRALLLMHVDDAMGLAGDLPPDIRKVPNADSAYGLLLRQKLARFRTRSGMGIKEFFNQIDVSNDGDIDTSELIRAVEQDPDNDAITVAEAIELMRIMDKDGDASISYAEFAFYCKSPRILVNRDALLHLFEEAWSDVKARVEDLRNMFVKADANGDGVLTLAEFDALVSKAGIASVDVERPLSQRLRDDGQRCDNARRVRSRHQ